MRPALVLLLLAGAVAPATAQLTPLTVPKGLLRVDFGGRFDDWDERFLEGTRQSTAGDFIRSPADSRWLPALSSAEAALRKVTGNQSLSLALGRTTSSMLVNFGTTSIGAAYGITRRLTVFGMVPIVRVRVQNTFELDSTGATAGFNPADPTAGGSEGTSTESFLIQFEEALATLQGRLTGGFYDSNPALKLLAQEALLQGSTLQSDLQALLTGSAFLPVTGSPGAAALSGTIETFRGTLVTTLGIPGLTASPALPVRGPIGLEFEDWATNPDGSVQARPFQPPILQYLGDIEVGMAYAWLDRRPVRGGLGIRSVLQGTVRLRTGRLDRTDAFFDFPTGDRQPDVQGDLVTDIMGGRVGARVTARYVLQLPGRQQRRIASPDTPVAPLNTLAAVSRDPGEILEGALEPYFRIAPTLALTGGVRYWSKARDTYTYVANQSPIPGVSLDLLSLGTKEDGLAFSAGLNLSHSGIRRDGSTGMPMDAALRFERVVRSSAGRVPARQTVSAMIRFYRKVF